MKQVMGNLSRLASSLASSGLDALIIVSPENVRYTGDVHISTQSSIRDRLAVIVWPNGAAPVFIVCAVEERYVRENTWIEDVRSYREFHLSPVDLLTDVLYELGLGGGRLGLELRYLPAQSFNELTQKLPSARFESCDGLLAEVRMVKTTAEIESLRQGFRATEQAMLDSFNAISIGDTEVDMAVSLAERILRGGASVVAFNHINAGVNTGYPHKAASHYRVRYGDLIKADSGGRYREYHSNVGRTAKFGPSSRDQADLWQRLLDIHRQLVALVRPGNCGRLVFEKAVGLHQQAGIDFPFGHNGHGVGLCVHEAPFISVHDETPFESGMIVAVETRTRREGEMGLHMNDLVEITEHEPIVHTGVFPIDEILRLDAR